MIFVLDDWGQVKTYQLQERFGIPDSEMSNLRNQVFVKWDINRETDAELVVFVFSYEALDDAVGCYPEFVRAAVISTVIDRSLITDLKLENFESCSE